MPRASADVDPEADGSVVHSVSLQRVSLAVAVALAALVVAVVHQQNLVFESTTVLGHVVRDAVIAVVSFALAWTVVRRVPQSWFD